MSNTDTQTTNIPNSRLTQPSTTLATSESSGRDEIKTITDEDDCAIELKKYEDVREEMKFKIDEYYKKILGLYTDNYNDYLRKISSTNQDDVDYANTQLKPKIQSYNNHLIKINQNLVNRVNSISELINKQKNSLTTKRYEIDKNYKKIQDLKTRDGQLKMENLGKNNQLKQLYSDNESNNLYYYMYLSINILFLVINILLLLYLIFNNKN